jgi:hypothetical protein
MDTRTVTRGNIIATVRSAYRRAPILAAQYMAALRSAYPELAEYELQQAALEPPKVSTTERDKMTEDDTHAWAEYVLKISHLNKRYALGAEYWTIANKIVPILARMSAIINGPFAIGANGRMEGAEVFRAFEAYMDEEDPEDSLWQDLVKAINEIDVPLTPAPQQPKKALTAEQMADPLSPANTNVGTMKSAVIS